MNIQEFQVYRKRVSWKYLCDRVQALVTVLKHRHMYCTLKYEVRHVLTALVMLAVPGWWARDEWGSIGPFLTKKALVYFVETYVDDSRF